MYEEEIVRNARKHEEAHQRSRCVSLSLKRPFERPDRETHLCPRDYDRETTRGKRRKGAREAARGSRRSSWKRRDVSSFAMF